MIIANEEKQTLQKKYAERIKNLATNLKQIIEQDDQETLEKTLGKIKVSSDRMIQLQSDWYDDQMLEMAKGKENEV